MTAVSTSTTGHYRALVQLGLPIIIGQLGTIILGFADTLMIGHHSMPELAAASFVNSLFTLVFVFSLGFCNGITPLVSSAYGRNQYRTIAALLRNSVVMSALLTLLLLVVMSVAFVCLPYMGQPAKLLPLMRPYFLIQLASLPFVVVFNTLKQFSDGTTHTRTGMWVVLMGNVMNIVGNWFLIYGHGGMPELGLVGAGISTLVSRIIMALVFIGVICFQPHYAVLRAQWSNVSITREKMLQINKMGWPLALQIGMETSAFNLSSVIVGWIGVTALAANQVLAITSQFCYFISSGMAVAIAIRVGLFHGQRNLDGVLASTRAGLVLVMGLLTLTGVMVWLVRWQLGGWFTNDVQVSALVAQSIVPLLAYQFSDGIQLTYANALRGLSKVRSLAPIAFFAYFVVCLPFGYLLSLPLGWGLQGIWWAYLLGLSLAAVSFLTVYRRAIRVTAQAYQEPK